MTKFLTACLAALATVSMASGGQLDLAVIEFPEVRDTAQVAAALARVRLAEITDADHTRTREAALRGGSVLFAQSLPVAPGQFFAAITRLGNTRAEVSGRLAGGGVSAEVRIAEGVRAGLRNYQSRVYSGSGSLAGGGAVLLSSRQNFQKSPRVVRGLASVEKTESMTIVAAQYRP